MSYNGSGTFVINTAGQPVVSGTVISSTAFNALTADLATGLSTAITKDGQTTPTANIPMGNNKITGLAVGTAATDAANLSQVQSTAAKLVGSVSGVDTITGTMSPTLAAYAAGQMFYFVAAGDNTGAVTLNLDGLGAKAVTRDGSVALAAGDIKSGEVVVVVYDGTRFQVVSQLNSAGNATFANVSITSALNVGGVATFTGNPVLSGGTANGVLYLNGSKVATSGSALVFDGTRLLVGKNTSDANNWGIQNYSAASAFASGIQLTYGGVGAAGMWVPAGSALAFGADGGSGTTELMRLTSTGLGIGTSSPGSKLDVVGNGATIRAVGTGTGSTTNPSFRTDTSSNAAGNVVNGLGAISAVGNLGGYVGTLSNHELRFFTNDTTRMLLDTSGNLGLGVTPSAWSGFRALQVGGATSIWSSTSGGGSSFYSNNVYYNGSNRIRINAGFATEYIQDSSAGQHLWFTAGSSTAGSTISFTQAMTLDASGNLGVGTTSITGRLQVKTNASGGVFITESTDATATYGYLSASHFTNGAFIGTYAGSNAAADILRLGTGGTERARIDSAGNFMVGVTSALGKVSILQGATSNTDTLVLKSPNASGAGSQPGIQFLRDTNAVLAKFYADTNSGALITEVNGSERARITSGGNLLVGKTADDTTTKGAQITTNGIFNSAGTTDFFNAYSTSAAANRFYVTNGGTIFATNTTISAISDQRLKENVRYLDVGLDAIMALKPRKFDWKEGKGKDIKNDRGFIAQEFEQVFPDLIDEWKDLAPEGEEPYKSLRQDLIPVLVKAIQELKAELDATKAEVAALKGA